MSSKSRQENAITHLPTAFAKPLGAENRDLLHTRIAFRQENSADAAFSRLCPVRVA